MIFEEFKGTGNSEIKLDRSLAEAHLPRRSTSRRAARGASCSVLSSSTVYTLRKGLQMPPQSAVAHQAHRGDDGTTRCSPACSRRAGQSQGPRAKEEGKRPLAAAASSDEAAAAAVAHPFRPWPWPALCTLCTPMNRITLVGLAASRPARSAQSRDEREEDRGQGPQVERRPFRQQGRSRGEHRDRGNALQEPDLYSVLPRQQLESFQGTALSRSHRAAARCPAHPRVLLEARLAQQQVDTAIRTAVSRGSRSPRSRHQLDPRGAPARS